MRVSLSILVFVLLFLGCKKSEKAEEKELVYDMYQPSEMSLLMQQMYEHNQKIKEAILSGETPTDFPEDFLEIHTAELSSFKSRNETFEGFSHLFIESEKQIFSDSSNVDLRERYNNTINLCISCHQTECTGPIPKIRKLLIP